MDRANVPLNGWTCRVEATDSSDGVDDSDADVIVRNDDCVVNGVKASVVMVVVVIVVMTMMTTAAVAIHDAVIGAAFLPHTERVMLADQSCMSLVVCN